MTNLVMISHGRLRLLQQALESLFKHTDSKSYNLCIVSDGEDDFRVTKYLRSINRKNVSLLEVGNSGHVLAQLKNLGVAWSEQRFGRGDWLYLSDSDVFFMDAWLSKLIMIAESSEPHGFSLWGGQVHPFHQPYPPHPMNGRFGFTEHAVLDGPSWLMRWETWDEYGPLRRDTAPGVCKSEEYPFCESLIKKHRIGVIHPHVVIHTGLTNSNGEPAPGAEERRALIPSGVYAE